MARVYPKEAMAVLVIACFLQYINIAFASQARLGGQRILCYDQKMVAPTCFHKILECPDECPEQRPKNFSHIACFVDCGANCRTSCRWRKPNCDEDGAICYEPRFIGGDGIMFYFHGNSNEDFCMISDRNLQINAHFIGRRPEGRTRDYTWVQSLGIMFGTHTFIVGATKVSKWDDNVDHLYFAFDGQAFTVTPEYLSLWKEPLSGLKVERTADTNIVIVSIPQMVELFVRAVPVTAEDNRVHNYQIPPNDAFSHLELQFKFFNFTYEVDGVLGQTYRPNFKNPVKVGVPMPIMGGENKYRTSSLLAADCRYCIFSPHSPSITQAFSVKDTGLDCTSKFGKAHGTGLACRR